MATRVVVDPVTRIEGHLRIEAVVENGVITDEMCIRDRVGQGEAGVENIFNHQHVLAFDGLVQILDHLDGAGGALAFAVTGDGHEVERCLGLDGA